MLMDIPEQQEKTAIWTKGFISLFASNLALNLGMNMNNSLLPLFADSLGATSSAIGLLMSSFAVSSILFRFVAAPVMDTYNRKYVVLFATIVLSIAFFGYSISNSYPMLLGFRVLQGCGMAFGNACCLAIVADMLPKEKYSSGIGYFSLAQVVCQALGPSIGLFLTDKAGFQTAYATMFAFMAVSVIPLTMLKTNHKRGKKLKLSFGAILAREALLPSSLMFLVIIGSSTITSFLILFAKERGVTSNISLYFTVFAVSMLVTRPLIGTLTDKFGFTKVAVPAFLCGFVAVLVIRSSVSLWGFLLSAFISAVGIGGCQPALQSLTMKSVTSERRGVASSTNYIGFDLGAVVGPVIAGGIVQKYGYASMWFIMSIVFLIAVLVTILFRNTIKKLEKKIP